MKLLEHIIKKYLFESNKMLLKESSNWTYFNKLKTNIRNKVEQLVPNAVKGFRLAMSGTAVTVPNAAREMSKWLTDKSNLKPTPESGEQPGVDSELFDYIGQYSNGNYVLIYGKDTSTTSKERQSNKTGDDRVTYNDEYNVIIIPIENLQLIVTNKNIDKIAVNAWKYPAAKGTQFEKPRTPAQSLATDFQTSANKYGSSPIIFSGNLASLQSIYKELLPIAREMKNTSQPGAAASRDSDISEAIDLMESLLNDYPDWARVTNVLSPRAKKMDIVQLQGVLQNDELIDAEKWDATNSNQAANIESELTSQAERESDAAAIASGNTVVEVDNKEYETKQSPTGTITFTGKWNLETQTPIDGVATNSAGDEWDGQWDENGNFFSGQGYVKYQDGREWRGSFNRGVPSGPGKFVSPTITFEGTVKTVNGVITPFKGYQNQTYDSDVPGKKDLIDGSIENSKLTKGTWIRYALESGKTVEYKFTGTFTPDENVTPLNGDVQKDGKPFGKFENRNFIKL